MKIELLEFLLHKKAKLLLTSILRLVDTHKGVSLITVHLKNEMKIEGVLLSIDKNMNMHIDINESRDSLPNYMQNLKTLYIRGNSIKYVTFDKDEI